MNNFVLIFLVFCSILLTSCASVVTFVDQGGFEQTIEVNTIPENVSVMKDGKIIGETPLTVSFSRKKNFSLTLKNEGYRTEHIRVTRKLNSWVYGNLPIATLTEPAPPTLIPLVGIDVFTGSIWKLQPDFIHVNMELQEQEIPQNPIVTDQQKSDVSELYIAKTQRSWWIHTAHRKFNNYLVVKMAGDILFMIDKHGNTIEVSIANIQSIGSKPELTLDQSLLWGGIGAYGGGAVGYFFGWPLFPAFGSDQADLRGVQAMGILGAAAGAVWTYKWRLRNKGVSRIKASMFDWSVDRKKEWIKSIVIK